MIDSSVWVFLKEWQKQRTESHDDDDDDDVLMMSCLDILQTDQWTDKSIVWKHVCKKSENNKFRFCNMNMDCQFDKTQFIVTYRPPYTDN